MNALWNQLVSTHPLTNKVFLAENSGARKGPAPFCSLWGKIAFSGIPGMSWKWIQYFSFILNLIQYVLPVFFSSDSDLTAQFSMYLFPSMSPTVQICPQIKEQMLRINGYIWLIHLKIALDFTCLEWLRSVAEE